MKEIPLTHGFVTIVDDEDYETLSKYKWRCGNGGGHIYYALRNKPRTNGQKKRNVIFMHRAIIGTPIDMETDHINGDGLDNRRCNLRVVTKRQNLQNMHNITKTSKYSGVHWSKAMRKWQAGISFNNKTYYLGRYVDEETAARRYRIACDWEIMEV